MTLDPPANRVFDGSADDPLRVATTAEIFASKCLVCAERSKTRDWFDLYVLIKMDVLAVDIGREVGELIEASLDRAPVVTV